ncbi:Clavaminate synthase-like protein [Aspergillus pseudoustus]|uniref:Clavaminate synthase-like protein n=1 Tax=Aspergillus pseudoustus TaxID=1810923 RepID=A0ABR4JWF2_9EURO
MAPSVILAEQTTTAPSPAAKTAPAETDTFEIPTVDISAFLADPDSPEAQAIIPIVRSACRSTGFFQIRGHGISKTLQRAVFAGAKKFFALPPATKNALDAHSNQGLRGYDVLASQSYEDGILPDLKEGFYTGVDLPPHDPRVQARRFLMGSNVWPEELAAQDFREPVEAYHTALMQLTISVLKLVERTLPYGPGIFDEFIAGDPITPMRMLHYPPARPEADKTQYGASAHTDFGAITLLLQEESPGLEVLDSRTGEWKGVPPDPDVYVVNVGDMLSFWTKDEYKSSVHRVINREPGDRYSIVFFFDGNGDAKLAPLDGSEEENPLTVEQHMIRRVAESYGKK